MNRKAFISDDYSLRRLIIRPGAIGDCILAMPAMEFLKADYTEVWVPSPMVPLIRFADRVRSIAGTGLDLLGLPDVEPPRGLVEKLRGFDSIVSWYGANREELRPVLDAEFLPALPGPDNREHCADFFARQVRAPTPAIPRLPGIEASGNDFAVIHPFSGSPRKNWPLERYRELAERSPLPVRWCAGPEETLPGATRIDNLWELASWIAGAGVYIGNDSGITHLAAATGVPVIAIFGPTDPPIWAPRGENVQVVHGNLEDVSVQEICDKIGWT
jgi:ADP-heptose:LPS heptosyltransferase